jgi:hypothetical protein
MDELFAAEGDLVDRYGITVAKDHGYVPLADSFLS